MSKTREISVIFDSSSENEGFARMVVTAFITRLDPTLEELADVKTAVSEAVTNAVIHGYENKEGKIELHCKIEDNIFYLQVVDHGVGIKDIEKAMEPLYTTKPEMERSGMGFSFMEAFMDDLDVKSSPGEGTTVQMKKTIYSALSV